ncbi:MAG: DnaJ domain-containing protein [Chloroflexota bacterium]|nr:DnaJ domain-containing protein [Chloroflexota bacterium]
MQPRRDAYLILQVDPSAHPDVIQAAYRVLARQLHPDGAAESDAVGGAGHRKMSDLNWAYTVLKDSERRAAYDRERRIGVVRSRSVASPEPGDTAQSPDVTGGVAGGMPGGTLDFGRYSGWRLRDVARRDLDYLRWLSRHGSGAPHREEIRQLLKAAEDRATHGH